MSTVAAKLPTTHDDLAEMGKDFVSFPASWEEYLELLLDSELKLEFFENKIYAMSYASDTHEELVSRLIRLLGNLFDDLPNYRVYGSNRPIHIADKKVFQPDVQLSNEQPKLIEYKKGRTAHLNPWLIVEVMSDSTEFHDYMRKLPSYKKNDSVQYILYVRQDSVFVSLFKRNGNTNVWLNTDFEDLQESLEIEGKKILLQDIYRKILA